MLTSAPHGCRSTAILSTFPSLNNTYLLPGSFEAGRTVLVSVPTAQAPSGIWIRLDTNNGTAIAVEVASVVGCTNKTVPLEFRHSLLEAQVCMYWSSLTSSVRRDMCCFDPLPIFSKLWLPWAGRYSLGPIPPPYRSLTTRGAHQRPT